MTAISKWNGFGSTQMVMKTTTTSIISKKIMSMYSTSTTTSRSTESITSTMLTKKIFRSSKFIVNNKFTTPKYDFLKRLMKTVTSQSMKMSTTSHPFYITTSTFSVKQEAITATLQTTNTKVIIAEFF